MTLTVIPTRTLKLAAEHLRLSLVQEGARVEKTRLRQRTHGVYALATVNGIAVETKLVPGAAVKWESVAKQLIALADEQGGSNLRVM